MSNVNLENQEREKEEVNNTTDAKSGNVRFDMDQQEDSENIPTDEAAVDRMAEKPVEEDISERQVGESLGDDDGTGSSAEEEGRESDTDFRHNSFGKNSIWQLKDDDATSWDYYGDATESVEREDTHDSLEEDKEMVPVVQERDKNKLFSRSELMVEPVSIIPEMENIPVASPDAVAFFHSLKETDLEQLAFDDSLITTSNDGDLGEFLISIKKCTFQDEECYSITAKSVGNIDGILCGTSLVAYVDKKLQTLEQRHHEYVELKPYPLDRKTLITRKNGMYVFIKTVTEGQETYQIQKGWNVKDLPILILEGSNTLLLRALVSKGTLLKDFIVPTQDSDGYLCNSDFKSLGEKKMVINNEDINTISLQRTIFSKIDSPISWNYQFIEDGHLLSRIQIGSHVRMRATELPIHILPPLEREKKPIFKKQPLDVDTDMEMKSKFIDKKDKFMNDFSIYLQQKPDIRSLLADFLQFLLLRKPDDVVQFAAEYFSSFSTHLVPPPSFLTTSSNTFSQNAPIHNNSL